MNSKLLVNDTIRSGDPEVDSYIEELESIVIAYTSDHATRLVGEANRVIGILADDLSSIADTGGVKGTKLIKAEKNNLIMDRIVKLMQQVNEMSKVSKMATSIGVESTKATNKEPEKWIEARDDDGEVFGHKVVVEEEDFDFDNGVPAVEALIDRVKKGINKESQSE